MVKSKETKKSHRTRNLILLGVVIAGGILIYRQFSSKNIQKPVFQTATVSRGTVVSTVSASGKVLTTNTLSITTQASGVVKKVYVKDGDMVFAGQKLAEIALDSDGILANSRAYASLVQSQNGVNSVKNNYRSTQATVENVHDQVKGHSGDETFAQKETRTKAEVANDNAYDSLRLASANLSASAQTYRLTSPLITAPFTGKVESVNLVEGMVLTSATSTTSINSQRVAVIKGSSLPVINVSLSEVDVPKVKVGQMVTVILDSLPDKTFTGKVATVDRVGSIASNVTSYSVNIKLDSDNISILPNMAATANIILQTKVDVLRIPSSALITQDGVTYARTLNGDTEVNIPVETGIAGPDATEIVSGLTEGQTVIIGVNPTVTTSTQTRSVFSGGFGGVGNVRVITR